MPRTISLMDFRRTEQTIQQENIYAQSAKTENRLTSPEDLQTNKERTVDTTEYLISTIDKLDAKELLPESARELLEDFVIKPMTVLDIFELTGFSKEEAVEDTHECLQKIHDLFAGANSPLEGLRRDYRSERARQNDLMRLLERKPDESYLLPEEDDFI